MPPGSHNNEHFTSGNSKGFGKAQPGIGLDGVSVSDFGILGAIFVPRLSRKSWLQFRLKVEGDEV